MNAESEGQPICSADLQSAVSPACSLLSGDNSGASVNCRRPADWKSAIRQVTNLRYAGELAESETRQHRLPRRLFLQKFSLAAMSLAAMSSSALAAESARAQIAITLDLEMSRNFPRWENTEWDYAKGLLNDETKKYSLEAARRVKARGGVIHFFVVGRVFEQENIDWLKELVREGHVLGNHTYDHVNVLAKQSDDIQFRFQRAAWLIAGKSVAQVIRENIEHCTDAMKQRLDLAPNGFRTPGGFANGLHGREDVQRMLLDLGFKWVSCKYPAHLYGKPETAPTVEVLDSIVQAQAAAQPFVYPTGLIDIPMSPISDVGAFRNARWKLEHFLEAIRLGVEWAIEHRAVFDLLCHPSVLYVMDPDFRTVELVCDLVQQAGGRAALVSLDAIANRGRGAGAKP